MTRRHPSLDPDWRPFFAASLALHLILALVMSGLLLHRPTRRHEQIQYVDIVSLPTANPSPVPAAPSVTQRIPPTPLPKPVKKQTHTPSPTTATASDPEAERRFRQRMDKIKEQSEEKHRQEALAAARSRISHQQAKTTKAPATSTATAGSKYQSYIHSRLTDAFHRHIALESKAPEIVARITITGSGKLSEIRIERSSGDGLFESAVRRSINEASEHFPPPPNGEEVSYGFVFKPEGVNKR